MEKLSLKKKLLVVRLYLTGLSYSEIAAKTGVSKASVANIVAEIKVGQLPGIEDTADQIEALRELAVGLKEAQVTPVQAVVGLDVLVHLNELGVEPNQIAQVTAVCHDLARQKGDAKALMKAALALEEVKKQTGLSVDEIDRPSIKEIIDNPFRLFYGPEDLYYLVQQLELQSGRDIWEPSRHYAPETVHMMTHLGKIMLEVIDWIDEGIVKLR